MPRKLPSPKALPPLPSIPANEPFLRINVKAVTYLASVIQPSCGQWCCIAKGPRCHQQHLPHTKETTCHNPQQTNTHHAPHAGLVHPKQYNLKDSNVELVNTALDHNLKHTSALTEPAWNDNHVGVDPGLFVWRIEDFAVVPVPPPQHGHFFDGDSYIILHSRKVGPKDAPKLIHDIFFYLGAATSQDEAGTAAYKTVELDEFLGGKATQHREVQAGLSEEFVGLFSRIMIRHGGVASGFRHVEEVGGKGEEGVTMLLRVFKHERGGAVVVHEVEPTWRSLDEEDVFILDKGDKIWVWQGRGCSPMEKAKAAQVVHDMVLAKHVEVEVLAQSEGRAGWWPSVGASGENPRPRRLFRLSDASGEVRLDLVRDGGESISLGDLDGDDIFLFDDAGKAVWVWQGEGASRAERAVWLRVAQSYLRTLQGEGGDDDAYLTPIAQVHQGSESAAFLKAVQVS
ncbi:hypothetical protein B0T17DRAFT_590707 [Bombardia bombarda]|uniref:Gelsolin-like domain-containing protein n=1 Tax=Bombardia bombarda TaxID=252184 RepID=A0AA39X0K5_9PEZI|nr:hypothetical protein B0T17DRAFT_590707 [Bombardia bombarda]